MVNDSWRCSKDLKKEHHFFGTNQLFTGQIKLKSHSTKLNIAVFHHPLNAFNEEEREMASNILKSQDYDVVICGHSHKYEADTLHSASGGFLLLNGRSAFTNPDEKESKFQPGYNILDLNIDNKTFNITARKYVNSQYRFDKDTESLKDGEFQGYLPSSISGVSLAKTISNNDDYLLPSSYKVNLEKIVGLLIGESLYTDKYIFLRELVQNSVDACNRAIDKSLILNPKITIIINSQECYVEVVDEGDGMTKDILKNHFSVIGKSISQDYNDNNGKPNLISQFGIGFISTFIVASKILIETKSLEDGLISFNIDNIFSGFKYLPSKPDAIEGLSGTKIRVYFKPKFSTTELLKRLTLYFRNIENLRVINDNQGVYLPSYQIDQNLNHLLEYETDRYTLKLGISLSITLLHASNCGFLIGQNPLGIMPHLFPPIIGGEINFKPKGIDLDLSRNRIIASPKSEAVRRELSIAMRKLFTCSLEGANSELKLVILNYIYHYFINYDLQKTLLDATHSNFYSKVELLHLIKDYSKFKYNNEERYLSEILSTLKTLGLSRIYIISKETKTDDQEVIKSYLDSKGFLVIENYRLPEQFRDLSSQQIITIKSIFLLISKDLQIEIVDIESISITDIFPDMTVKKSEPTPHLKKVIKEVEISYDVIIEFRRFGSLEKQYMHVNKTYFLNLDHVSIASLMGNAENEGTINAKIYILGILGLPIK